MYLFFPSLTIDGDCIQVQVYCSLCDRSSWVEVFEGEFSESITGLIKRSIYHKDHVLICEIDVNGFVRQFETIRSFRNTYDNFATDIAHMFQDLNSKNENPLLIDIYTTDSYLTAFFYNVMSQIMEFTLLESNPDGATISTVAFQDYRVINTQRYDIGIGPRIRKKSLIFNTHQKGLILDMHDVEKEKLNIEDTINSYNWVAVITPKLKKDAYFHSISSLCTNLSIPFFIDVITNKSLKALFDFVHVVVGQF